MGIKTEKKPALRASWRILMLVSANLASGRYCSVSDLLRDARKMRIPPLRIYEIILQCYLFLGYPRSIEGLKLLHEHYPAFTPPDADEIGSESSEKWQNRGERLCRKVYGSNYEPLRDRIKSLSPDLDQWMVWEGYGKVLSRDGVPSALRELCTCSALVVTGDIVQLHSHMIGAIHVGASWRMLEEMIDLLNGTAKAGMCRGASALLNRISQKAGKDA
ncbi:MAG: hypothetical protein ABIK83_03270 [Candidatus Zixiibacteriota bacterium]